MTQLNLGLVLVHGKISSPFQLSPPLSPGWGGTAQWETLQERGAVIRGGGSQGWWSMCLVAQSFLLNADCIQTWCQLQPFSQINNKTWEQSVRTSFSRPRSITAVARWAVVQGKRYASSQQVQFSLPGEERNLEGPISGAGWEEGQGECLRRAGLGPTLFA